MASAVLGTQATAEHLWQVAEVGVQAGVEALEEAVGSGLLREENAGAGRPGRYRFAHDLIHDVVYTELGQVRRLVLHQRALALLHSEGARPSELAYHALAAGEAEAATRYSVEAGDETVAVFAVEDAIGHYEQARLAPGAAAAADRAGSLGGRTPLRLPGAGLCLPQRLGEGPRRL